MPIVYPEVVDWLDCEWGGPYGDEEAEEWVCLPIYGPLNKDGFPLGFVLTFL